MRGTGWIAPLLTAAIWILVIAYPAVHAARTLARPDTAAPPSTYVQIKPAARLLAETAGYSLVVTVAAVLLGWLPGRWLGASTQRRGFVVLAAVMLLPISLPAYVVFYMWWQMWPPDGALFAWAAERDLIPAVRHATLLVGLVCWSWPLVAWCVAGSAALTPASRVEMLRLDGAGRRRRLGEAVRADGRGLLLGGLLVALVTFNNTTSFDLAQIFTFGNELRAIDAAGASPRAVLVAALPAIAAAGVGAALLWMLLRPPSEIPLRVAAPGRATIGLSALVGIVAIAVPTAALVSGLGPMIAGDRLDEFLRLYGPGLGRTLRWAAVSGALAVVIAVGQAAAWMDHRPLVRALAHVAALGWLVAALVPGTVVGVALEAAYNLDVPLWPGGENADAPLAAGTVQSEATLASVVYRRQVIIVLGHLARFGFVAALLARWLAAREPKPLTEVRRLDGAETLGGMVRSTRPRLLAAAVASAAIVTVLAFGEIAVTARVHPPGSDPIAVSLLNAMHYQRPETVTAAVAVMLVIAAAAAALAALALAPRRGVGATTRLAAVGALLVAMTSAGGCGLDESAEAAPLRVSGGFGATGLALGQFSYPRCIAVDADREVLYVVDKTARVQRFGFDGTPQTQWRMPAKENGKPTGVSVAPDGRVFVADTHYFRIIAYDADGDELMRFGRYGEGPGEFIYPTDVAFGTEGRLYVAEYGGHDRIQVFSPEGEYEFEFGSFGAGDGQFDRPQSILFNAAGTELYVADSCNHRIVVVDPQGRELRRFGSAGTGPGEMHYPYGLAFLEDGTLLVAEFGNNRIQRFTTDGRSLGVFGRVGAGAGELQYPWGVATAAGTVFVLDSGNNRVQTMTAP